jgi:hypothetical protein
MLARYARACIREELGGPRAEPPRGGAYDQPGATFVSLHRAGGHLQGCIGTLEPHRALADDVARNARAAAFHDPRGVVLTLGDVDWLAIEVSVLGPLESLPAVREEVACAALRSGIDGVVLAWEGRRATFIPRMWDHFDDARTLLAELKLKAGLPRDFWAPDVQLWRYTAVVGLDPPASREVRETRSGDATWPAAGPPRR